jgi:hypothetical protein
MRGDILSGIFTFKDEAKFCIYSKNRVESGWRVGTGHAKRFLLNKLRTYLALI